MVRLPPPSKIQIIYPLKFDWTGSNLNIFKRNYFHRAVTPCHKINIHTKWSTPPVISWYGSVSNRITARKKKHWHHIEITIVNQQLMSYCRTHVQKCKEVFSHFLFYFPNQLHLCPLEFLLQPENRKKLCAVRRQSSCIVTTKISQQQRFAIVQGINSTNCILVYCSSLNHNNDNSRKLMTSTSYLSWSSYH